MITNETLTEKFNELENDSNNRWLEDKINKLTDWIDENITDQKELVLDPKMAQILTFSQYFNITPYDPEDPKSFGLLAVKEGYLEVNLTTDRPQ